MRSTTTNLVTFLTLISTATAAVHDVKVGDGGLAYEPSTLKADKGDTVVFHFYPGDHNVVQGPFNTPCDTSSGFYSGFIDSESGPSNTTFTITISDTTPIWIYCSQQGHCQSGMAMAINAPTTGNTLAAYIAAAAKTSISTTPANVGGGVVGTGSGSSSSTAPSSSAAPKSSSSSSHAGSTSAAAGGGSSSSAGSGSSTAAAAGTSASSTPASSPTTGTSTSASSTATNAAVSGFGGETSVMGVLAVLALWAGIL